MESSTLYHISSASVSPELLFRDEENIRVFREKLDRYIAPIATIQLLSISPCAFDLVAEIKDIREITRVRAQSGSSRHFSSRFIIQQFANVLNGYARYYNVRYQRSGALFRKNFRHGPLSDDEYSDLLAVLL